MEDLELFVQIYVKGKDFSDEGTIFGIHLNLSPSETLIITGRILKSIIIEIASTFIEYSQKDGTAAEFYRFMFHKDSLEKWPASSFKTRNQNNDILVVSDGWLLDQIKDDVLGMMEDPDAILFVIGEDEACLKSSVNWVTDEDEPVSNILTKFESFVSRIGGRDNSRKDLIDIRSSHVKLRLAMGNLMPAPDILVSVKKAEKENEDVREDDVPSYELIVSQVYYCIS